MFRINKDLKQILHPYIFVLKEGREFSQNYLDYSLLFLHVGTQEIIKSPPLVPKEFLHEVNKNSEILENSL